MSDEIIRFVKKATELLSLKGCPFDDYNWQPKDKTMKSFYCVSQRTKDERSDNCWHEYINEQLKEQS